MADELPTPKSRKEEYLAKAAGMDVGIPDEPKSREEQYLNAIAEGGGGGGGYVLPIATADKLGGVKVGTGLAIDADTGVLSTSGGSGPTVVQTTGTSQTDVMSQDAVTQMVFTSADKSGVRIGAYSGNFGSNSIAIGCSATSGSNNYATALGFYAQANKQGSIALGAFSRAQNIGEVNVGSTTSNYGYGGNTFTRVIRGVHDGVDTTDAVTVNQISQLVTAINSACGTSIMLASDGSITNANSGNNSGNVADPGISDEPAPEDEPGPE